MTKINLNQAPLTEIATYLAQGTPTLTFWGGRVIRVQKCDVSLDRIARELLKRENRCWEEPSTVSLKEKIAGIDIYRLISKAYEKTREDSLTANFVTRFFFQIRDFFANWHTISSPETDDQISRCYINDARMTFGYCTTADITTLCGEEFISGCHHGSLKENSWYEPSDKIKLTRDELVEAANQEAALAVS